MRTYYNGRGAIIKISYLLESVGLTGGNLVIFKHMDALVAAGHTVFVVTPYGYSLWSELRRSQGEVALGYFGNWGALKKVQLNLRRRFPNFESCVSDLLRPRPSRRLKWITSRLISNCPSSEIVVATHSYTAFAASYLSQNRKVRAYHHMQGFEPWFAGNKHIESTIAPAYHLPLKRFANCSWLAQFVCEEGAGAIPVVHPGVDHKLFSPLDIRSGCLGSISNESTLLKSDSFTTGSDDTSDGLPTLRILSYCDPRPLKGWKESVGAMEIVFSRVRKICSIEWHVFGHGIAAGSKVPITHHGFLSHKRLAELYRSSDLFFLPSWFESFPLQPLEAMASGTAVVTTRIGTEDYARDEQTALIVEPRSSTHLADAILRLVIDDELRRYLVVNGHKVAREFTWERSGEQLLSVLDL